MKIVIITPLFEIEGAMKDHLKSRLPYVSFLREEEVEKADEVIAAIVDNTPNRRLNRYRNLQILFSLSAGVDNLLKDPSLPNVPIVKLINANMRTLMAEYILFHAIGIRRNFFQLQSLQAQKKWIWFPLSPPIQTCKVTVLGLGRIGKYTAQMLSNLGFQVNGWSKCPKCIQGIKTYTGQDALQGLLPHTDILVCLLPLTQETNGLIGKKLLEKLPKGASLINAGRGECIVEEELIDIIEAGHLSYIVLDVFKEEPLPPTHKLWSYDNVIITPHLASSASSQSYTEELVQKIEAFSQGNSMDTVNLIEGY